MTREFGVAFSQSCRVGSAGVPGREEGRRAEPAPGVLPFTPIGDPEPRGQASGQRLTTGAPGTGGRPIAPSARVCRTRSEPAPCCKGATARLGRPLGPSRSAAPGAGQGSRADGPRGGERRGDARAALINIPGLAIPPGLGALSSPLPFPPHFPHICSHRWRGLLGALQPPPHQVLE